MTGTGNVPSNGEKQGTENHEAKSEKVPRVPSNGTEDKNRSITMEEFYPHAAKHKAANTQVEDLGVQYPLFPGQKPQSDAVSRLLGRKGQ